MAQTLRHPTPIPKPARFDDRNYPRDDWACGKMPFYYDLEFRSTVRRLTSHESDWRVYFRTTLPAPAQGGSGEYWLQIETEGEAVAAVMLNSN